MSWQLNDGKVLTALLPKFKSFLQEEQRETLRSKPFDGLHSISNIDDVDMLLKDNQRFKKLSLPYAARPRSSSERQIERPDWHAQLSLDLTDLYVRYLKSGPGNLERDIERKFSYALSREDLENAILGGP
ncbi:hypothetical protein R1flu_001694 [Riccia fluitans]|uniref:Uncharacterized protein n=1 Tax=Riccia fluitans TaxID=41844 RepID=A0ABD1Y510_9MARC